MYKDTNGMLTELFRDMFTPLSDIHKYDATQTINKNFFPLKLAYRGQQSITYIGPVYAISFYPKAILFSP